MRRYEIWQLADGKDVGGIERHVGELVTALCGYGVPSRAVLYARHPISAWRESLQCQAIPYRELGGTARNLLQALWCDRPALLHTHGYKAGLVGRLCARALGIPVVSTFHAGERAAWPVSLYQSLDEASAILAHRISVSRAIADRLPWSSTVIDNFVGMPVETMARSRPHAVAFVGRLSAEKGPDIFCEIARTVGPSVSWDVYGDGPMRAALQASAPRFVRFHGFASNMAQVWPNVGLLLMPSRAEGLPMAALEALARGIPVAASAVGGLPDLTRGLPGDWLFRSGDAVHAGAIVDRWRKLQPRDRDAFSAFAVELVRSRYSPDAVLPRLLDIYRAAGWAAIGSSSTNVQSSAASGTG